MTRSDGAGPIPNSSDGAGPIPNTWRLHRVGEAELGVATWGGGPPEIVLLHDGLGSIGQWRSLPERIAAATGRTVAAYDRPGHGSSTPVPTGPWPADWLHVEADRLIALLDVLDAVDPLLVGHSDGGSIALIATADGLAVRGVVALAAHSWVEQVCVDEIAAMRARPDRIIAALGRSHDHPDAVFDAWSGVWVGDDFRPWDIRADLAAIDVPVLVAQGTADEYAPDAMAHETAAAIGANATCRLLADLGHLLHHQDVDAVVELIADVDAAASVARGSAG